MSATLFYIHDPMCSWCYAFERALSSLEANLPGSIQIKKLVGGLAPDTTAIMPLAMQQSIQDTWQRIEQMVPHIRFNYDFWSLNRPIRSTYPSCRAVLAASKQCAEFEDRMIHAIQNAYYQHAQNPALQAVLVECANDAGLEADQFVRDLHSFSVEKELQEHIGLARKMGATTFPSLRLRQGDRLTSIPIDYQSYELMLDEIKRVSEF